MSVIPYINFLSRWLLFLAALYKTTKTKEKRWGLITIALFINALDVESYILTPLGVSIKPEAYEIASKIPNFLIAGLLFWGGIQLKKERSEFKDVVALGVFAVAAYIWLFLLATEFFEGFKHSFAIKASFPSFVFGVSLIYVGYVLRNYVISKNTLEELFPWGLILLGAINLTYPFIRNIESIAPVAFLLAAVFRLMAAVGALKFVIYPSEIAVFETPKQQKPPGIKGTFIFKSKEDLEKVIPDFFKQNVIMITRNPPKEKVPENTLVYWLTKIEQSSIKSDGKIYPVSPTRIDILIHLLTKNLESGYNAVYMDGFEYLMIENGFESAVKFLFDLKDRVISEGKVIALIIDPRTLTEKQMALLEREFGKRT
ncbi:hypothetical protein ADU37_CDS05720 [Thermococcus sp. 2319x1]|uniref:DUF835 domain-containing protein n=1 Tax=Thermococcus sp. 2319x1 TaxID=1674923 RepID=UPI00073A6B82|nr:DUF835 domain-containing protein [Thermococcus sp. 2319x1]ALV62271.1 hypothetical protein ADU37_CDS05720 [Thermococcus sp. 2319x1]